MISVYYGTETNNAKDVGELIFRYCKNRRLPVVCCESVVQFKWTAKSQIVVFVVATTGDGEVPRDMKDFWGHLLQKKLGSDYLSLLEFAVFGLGDSSYAKYNAVARRLDTRLKQVGGTCLLERGLGDDQHPVGYQGALNPWLVELMKILVNRFPLPEGFLVDDALKLLPAKYSIRDSDKASCLTLKHVEGSYGMGNVVVVENERMTEEDWSQDVRHIRLKLEKDGIKYLAGDVLWMYPENNNVEEFMECMGYEERRISINAGKSGLPDSCLVSELFTKYLDIHGTPKRFFFEQLALFAQEEEDKEKLLEMASPEGADLFHNYCTREKRTFVEIFKDFKSCRPSLEYVLELVPCMLPRGFSISSSQYIYPNEIHLTVAIIDFKTPYNRRRVGVCTSWLATLPIGFSLPVWISRGLFTLPKDKDVDMILIGPGTGVAPMRALIQERCSIFPTCTKTHLYFGSRHIEKDFLYGKEFKAFAATNSIQFYTAFSRDQPEKIYVQARLYSNRKIVATQLLEGAYVFIAGSAKRMPTDIYETLRDILCTESNLSLKQAESLLKQLIRQKRYIVESWS